MTLRRILSACALTAAACLAAPSAFAQSHPEFIPLGRVSAALYKPDSGPAPHIMFLVSHRTGNNLNNGACKQLAARGFACLGWNTRFVNNEAAVHWEDIAFDVKAAMDFARSYSGITKVVFIGHSGGSPLAAYYEAVAEAGPGWCQGPNKLVQCVGGAQMTGWKPADGIVFPDAHPGNGTNTIRGLNPSLSVVNGKIVVDPALDPFNPANGYSAKGDSHYPDAFRKKYYAAQAVTMNALIAKAQAMQASMKAGKARYSDDDVFLVIGSDQAGAAKLNHMDTTMKDLMATKRPEKLLKNDGTIVTQIVHSVALPQPEIAEINRQFDGGTKALTVKSFLSTNAVKATNAYDGIDHCSTNNSVTCAVQSIKIPTLIAAMGAFEFIPDQEEMYDLSAAKDKDYIVIEGAVHGYTACKPCEKTPGQYANSEKNLWDYVAKWTNSRM